MTASELLDEGNSLLARRQLAAAAAKFEAAIAVDTECADAHFGRGNALSDLQQFEAAIGSYDVAIQCRPDYWQAYSYRGLALWRLNRLGEAIESYDRAISIQPHDAESLAYRGATFRSLKQPRMAIESFDAAVAHKPDYAEAYNGRGAAWTDLEQYGESLKDFDQAIALKNHYAEAHLNRGHALGELRRWDEALISYERAIAIRPKSAEVHLLRGHALRHLQRWDAAMESFNAAIAINPDLAGAYVSRGDNEANLKQYAAAAESYGRAMVLKPDSRFLLGRRRHMRMCVCDWDGFDADVERITADIDCGVLSAQPFVVQTLIGSAAIHQKSAELLARKEYASLLTLPVIARRDRARKIHVGYFSPDFRHHPVSILTAQLFETHDRSQFEVTAFSFGPAVQDDMRTRLQGAFDRFVDVRTQSDRDVALLARNMGVDIAVDLGGFTEHCRPRIFALRAAPVQISYIGYLGTMGAPFMDYLIADPVLVPPSHRHHYAEKILFLPSYQANDCSRRISERQFTRQEFGLPANAFVFCCFNGAHKIQPATFAGWMRVLERVRDSVLLLYASGSGARENLRKAATGQGIDPGRIHFAHSLPYPDYLARFRAADLFLDTLPYNAGATASDALWAGLPVLTCAGEAFCSRMAASLLTALRMPELITSTQEQYEALAVELASHPRRLADLRAKLADNRLTTSLFDIHSFTRHLEAGYTRAYERHHSGLPAQDIGSGDLQA